MTRREILKLSLLGTAGLILPGSAVASSFGHSSFSREKESDEFEEALRRVGEHHSEEAVRETALMRPYLIQSDDEIESPATEPFRDPLPFPPVLPPDGVVPSRYRPAQHFTVVERASQREFIPGLQTPIWAYNGIHPGPTIPARLDRPVVVTFVNELPAPTIIHFHGGHQAPEDDGFAADQIPPGGSRDLQFSNRPDSQRGYTMWYHDHRQEVTSQHVYLGLAGFYLLDDEFEDGLREARLLPRGLAGTVPREQAHDIPMVIQARTFAPDGRMFFELKPGNDGNLGDKIMVNGAIQPRFEVATRKYRFRILNGASARDWMLTLSNGMPFTQIGTEGGLLMRPVEQRSLLITVAERFDVILDFSKVRVGSRVTLLNRFGHELWKEDDPVPVMRFDVVREEQDDVQDPPSPLRPVEPRTFPDESRAVRTREFVLERKGGIWVVNGRPWDVDRDDADPEGDTVEIWEGVNKSGGWAHSAHVHDEFFRILTRNGRPAPPHEALGYKETLRLGPNERVRVAKYFSPDFPGRFNFHCHNTDHEDHHMMGVFRIRPKGG